MYLREHAHVLTHRVALQFRHRTHLPRVRCATVEPAVPESASFSQEHPEPVSPRPQAPTHWHVQGGGAVALPRGGTCALLRPITLVPHLASRQSKQGQKQVQSIWGGSVTPGAPRTPARGHTEEEAGC